MSGKRTHDKMGYFKGWKFGVPVVVLSDGVQILKDVKVRLIYECDYYFIVLIRDNACHAHSQQFSSDSFKYIPIPYKVNIMQPRFLICTNRRSIVYCNRGGRIARLEAVTNDVHIVEVKELRGAKCSAKT